MTRESTTELDALLDTYDALLGALHPITYYIRTYQRTVRATLYRHVDEGKLRIHVIGGTSFIHIHEFVRWHYEMFGEEPKRVTYG